jgi:hypothetical protein
MESTASYNTTGLTMTPFAPSQAYRPSGSIGQMATRAIKSVVPGYVAGDGKRYAESLKKNFNIGIKDGYQFVNWAPASLGGATNPADLTGAMASFYHHASARITQAREELRKLEPMCEADHEDCCEDIRLVIRSKLDELEAAFGADCGPCEEWVEEVFVLLLGNDADEDDDIDDDDHGLIGRLEDEYTEEDSAYCPEEEIRLAKIRLFRSALISLCEEWRRFADEFIHGDNRSSSLIVHRLGHRSVVISKSISIIRDGLLSAGYSSEQLTVELLDDEEEEAGIDPDEEVEPLTACCAMTRLETFACTRAPDLLRTPGVGAFISLTTESRQLERLACMVRGWLMGKLINNKDLDDCLRGQGNFPVGNRAWIKAAEGTGAISLAIRGVMAAAFTLWQQMRFFHADVETLLPTNCFVKPADKKEDKKEEEKGKKPPVARKRPRARSRRASRRKR